MIGSTVSHYKILGKLGEGGMGVVYRARDVRLNRFVALKFLPPRFSADETVKRRFIREAKAASALDHPHICTIYAIDETGDGRLFIAMGYYEGQTLREKIARGPLAVEEALAFAEQVASGLARAHEAGIVHRDVKPANVIVTDRGEVKILDFGVAKLSGVVDLTAVGSTLGTVAYMSPEQARGEDVDHRADIWSLGVVLYEMLAGQRPFRGDFRQAVLYAVLNEDPEPVSAFREDLPAGLDSIIGRLLARDRTRRYPNVKAFLSDLHGAAAGSGAEDVRPEKSIVVLPFANVSPDPDQEYFCDGIVDEIITDLSQVEPLRVLSRNSSMMLKGTKKDLRTIGRELDVRYALDGSVRKAGDRLRIAVQLIEVHTDRSVWAEKYHGTLANVFDVQEEISRAIVQALKVTLTPAEGRKLAERPIDNVRAHESYLRARYEIWRFSEESLHEALRNIRNALALVGDNELLYATLGHVYTQFVQIGVGSAPQLLDQADACADKALTLKPESAYGHWLRGNVYFHRGEIRKARSPFEYAFKQDPHDLNTLLMLGYLYCLSGEVSRAKPLFKHVLEVDPLTPLSQAMPGFVAVLEGRFEDALGPYATFYEMDPASPFSRWCYAWALCWNRRLDEAKPVVDSLSADYGDIPFASLARSLWSGLRGDPQGALAAITPALRTVAGHNELFSRELTHCLAVAGETDAALEALENSVRIGLVNYPFLATHDWYLDPLRGSGGFQQILERVRQEWEQLEADPRPARA